MQAVLVLALDRVTRRAELERREQVADKLREEGWRAAAEFCASVQQSETLRLRPWQQPPCNIDPDPVRPVRGRGRRTVAAHAGGRREQVSPRSARRARQGELDRPQ